MDIEKLYELHKKYQDSLDNTIKDEYWATPFELDTSYQFVIFVCDELGLPYPKEIQNEIDAEEERRRVLSEQIDKQIKAREAKDRLVAQKKAERAARNGWNT